ncbi:M3 family metallopeptidase [Sphingorhabdus soli]|uniref:Dipeptidyl carboxypeptidase n=1 Tax=Flavisphingopyxis soli TaxID=2601267 RepID=A0A5C6ULD0_9SPHN|nr:M3 family metallopeptidase [Sphingorhabdus soli]TXC74042.1 M3 family metallopeptidase [Sphingorhabdus soli]
MMKTALWLGAATAALAVAGCTTTGDTGVYGGVEGGATTTASTDWMTPVPKGTGVFAQASTLPFEAPPFDKISDADYAPAFEQGMAINLAEIQNIANNPAAPTFDNTIAAMEKSGRMLERVALTFFNLQGANTNDTLDAVATEMSPKLAAHNDAIYLNEKLFARVDALYKRRDALGLTPEQKQVLSLYHDQFVHAGTQLSGPDKEILKDLNGKLSSLETAFSQKLVAAAKDGALVIDNKAELAGFDAAQIAQAASEAKDRGMPGKYVLPLQNTTQQPYQTSLKNRATRKKLFEASWNRAERGDANDTRDTIEQIALLRAQKAKLLGFPDYASYTLNDQMAKTPAAAIGFMQKLAPGLAAAQKAEAAEIQAAMKADGVKGDLQPWDWQYYANKVYQTKYAINQDEVKPYFEIHKVLEDGVFYAANQLYGLTFKKRTDLPVYQPDVMVYTVYDADGSELGLMYFDYWKRDNKQGGAWMNNFVTQSDLNGTKPVIYNVGNFAKPADGQPALITFDDATTMFHEFGHALHGLFADSVYPYVSGTNTARDFVEFPSQFNEHWASDPKVFANYAKHYKTGAPMPAPLVAKLKKAANFGNGYGVGETLEAALLDMKWHSLPASAGKQDADSFEAAALASLPLDTADVPPRYRSSYFLHIWGNGYAAGYYAYLWTKMLDEDSYDWFVANGGMTRANGQRYRDMILSRGHELDYGEMFRAFYGKDPDIAPLLKGYGIAPGAESK